MSTELMLAKASKVLQWIGWIALGAMGTVMLIFGFVAGLVAVSVLAVQNGGDPSPIFSVVKFTQFLWQFGIVMFLFAGLLWAFSLLAKSRRERWEKGKDQYFEEMKETILEALEEAPEFKLNKSRRKR